MVDIDIFVSFTAGLVSFFAPCAIPLLPAYLAFITGVSKPPTKKSLKRKYKKRLIISSIFYVLGFSMVFTLLGVVAGGVGAYLRQYTGLVQRFGGLIIIILGMEFTGILKLGFLKRTYQFRVPKWTNGHGAIRAFFVGLIFAFSWTPCIGAILGSILALAASTKTAATGAWFLFVYSLGISIPFFLVSYILISVPEIYKRILKHSQKVSQIAGIIFIIMGILLFTDTYKYLNGLVFKAAYLLGYGIGR